MKFVASMNDCRQYSEDGWESIQRVLAITDETTVKDLLDWQAKVFPVGVKNKTYIPIHIFPVEEIKKKETL